MRRPLILIAAALGIVLVVGGVIVGVRWMRGGGVPFVSDTCRITADGKTVRLDPEQAKYVATITAVRLRNNLPERAGAVALATALQESKLRNLPGGDRDSVGLFQQRPSQGWGTPEQLQDPRYTSDQFYKRLKKVHGWESMRVTEAAQAVQRSAAAEAYQQWEQDALVMAKAFDGTATHGAVTCILRSDGGETKAPASNEPIPPRSAEPQEDLLTHLGGDLGERYARPDKAGGSANGTTSLRVPHTTDGDVNAGWRLAYWLVAHAQQHHISSVAFGTLRWDSQGGSWQEIEDSPPPKNRVVLQVGPASTE